MLPCEDVQRLIEDHVVGTLDDERRREVVAHLKTCAHCHQAVDAARLAKMVLGEVNTPSPPPTLAAEIKNAVQLRLQYRPRPLHERALGSPAFMATCASLLCGAIICLVAILRVGAAGSIDEPATVVVAEAPTERAARHSDLPARPLERTIHPRAVPVTRIVARELRQRPVHVATVPRARTVTRSLITVRRGRSPAMATAVSKGSPASSVVAVLPDARVLPAVQRISMPASAVDPIRPAATVEPTAMHLDDVRLMDLTAPQPGIRAEFIRTD